MSLARRGAAAVFSMGFAALVVVGAVVLAIVLTHRGAEHLLERIPILTSTSLAWLAGATLAFAAAAGSLTADATNGIRTLIVVHAGPTRAYVRGRVLGLVLLVALVVGGGTLVTGAACAALAPRPELVARTLSATAAALVYAVAFAVVIGPVAFAALGARSRVGGYLALLLVLVVPEVVEPLVAPSIPDPWNELVSLPSALGAMRAAITPPDVDLWRFSRAAAVLAFVATVAFALVQTEVARLDAEDR
jgi:hypothetical protein